MQLFIPLALQGELDRADDARGRKSLLGHCVVGAVLALTSA